MKTNLHLSLLICASLLACSANAAVITFTTASGATSGGQPVDASATFTTGANTVMVTISDLLANPTDAAQLISDLSFGLTTGQTSGTLASSLGTEVTVGQNGSVTLGPTVSTGWSLTTAGGNFLLNVLGTPIGPAHLIIGPAGPGNVYTAANGSIANNPAHNPFLNGSATFTLTVPGVTADSSINNVFFSFGTTPTTPDVPGIPPRGGVPDGGTTVMLLGAALSGLALMRRRLK